MTALTRTARFLLLAGFGCRSEAPRPAPNAPAAPAPTPPGWIVGPDGVGAARIGSTLVELNAALGEHFPARGGCAVVRPAGFPDGVSLMLESDTVMRVDVDSAGVATAEGAEVGTSEERIGALYPGRVRVMPHKYTSGHYLVVSVPADTLRLLIFETDGRAVVKYRAGRRPQVEYVEGCG